MKEERDIIGYDGLYTIDTDGNIYSHKRKKVHKLKPQRASQSKKGYYQVRLFPKHEPYNKGYLNYVHRLVYETFVGPIPEGFEIDHIDADTTNNKLENLQILTRKGNMKKHSYDTWNISVRDMRDELIKLYKELGSYKKVSEKTGIHVNRIYRTIKDIVHYRGNDGEYWTRRYSDISDEFTDSDLRNKKVKKDVLDKNR